MSDQLSSHFREAEFFELTQGPNKAQRFLAEKLCVNILEPIRAVVGCGIYVSDGCRNHARHLDLKRRNYHPSPTSDHSFLLEWHPQGVGAADVLKLRRTRQDHFTREAFTEIEYHDILADLNPDLFGQLIWYRDRGHIHASNPRSLWFTDLALENGIFRTQRKTYIKDG